ncbi:MAG TPA: Xaa-Pro peptidase family protein, partial [Candidatus Binatia bacterium]|nr:Xaa-Pro peptidase family protein [Candidatus Binatia bacterium]
SIEGRVVVEEPSPFPPLRMQDGSTPIPELAQQRRMNVERAMADAGIDGMVLFKPANLRYATGGRAAGGIVKAGAPPLPLAEPTEANANAMTECAARIAEALSGARCVAIDRWSAPLFTALRRALPRIEWADADALLAAERIVKLPAELVELRRAQELNEQAVTAVLEALRPGIREIDLTAVFHDALEDLGGAEVLVESVWCALPKARVEAPWTTPGTLPYRELTSERVLREGDLVAMDTGILREGYMSDFGRTWRCGDGPANGEERRLFEQWLEICERLMAACRPGNTALSLRRAALAGWRRPEPPWPVPLYVAHSLGLGGVEPPFVGTDLGEAVEDRWLLRPGMVLVLEPYVWEEGIGGYRAEETVVVTEGGCERFTRFSYGAFET